MAIAIILGMLFAILCIVGIICACAYGYKLCNTSEYDKEYCEEFKYKYTYDPKGKKKVEIMISLLIVVSIIMFILFLIIPFSIHQVKAGEVAVVKHLGEAKVTRMPGTYFDFWITEKYEKYDAKVQTIEIESSAYSKDAQTMDLKISVQYQINTSKAIEISNHYGNIETLADRVKAVSIEKAKSSLSSYSAMNIIETRAHISPEIEKVIKDAISDSYYVDIVAVVITDIDFSSAFEKVVEEKMIAEQEILKAENEKKTAIINAEKELEVAKRAAEAKIEQAKAEAQSQIEVAKAEAQAVQLKSLEIARMLGFTILEEEIKNSDGIVTDIKYSIDFSGKDIAEISLITDYLKYADYLSKWNGELPGVISGDAATIIIPKP